MLGCNQFSYCFNNPVNLSDSSGNWPEWIKNATNTVKKATQKVINAIANAINYAKSSFSPANHVTKAHVTTPTAMLDLGPMFGKVGFSSTVTKQDKEPGLVHSYLDVGNDASEAAVGINIVGWLGVDIGGSTEGNLFVSAQVTPWIHGKVSCGVDGMGAVIGLDVGDISSDFEIKAGWGLIAIFVAPHIITSAGNSSMATQ